MFYHFPAFFKIDSTKTNTWVGIKIHRVKWALVVKVWHVLRLRIEEMSSRIWRVVVNKLGIQGGYSSRVGCLETADGVTGQRLMLPDCYEMLHSAWGLNRGSGGRLVVLWL